MAFIELAGVSKAYATGTAHRIVALDAVNLDIAEQEFFVLLGPSGSGKTTLLNLLAAIDRPDAGRVTVASREISAPGARDLAGWRARNVGYVFQTPNLVPVLTAFENVELPLWLQTLSARERAERVALALDLVGLADRANHRPKELSGGQEQRVAIARAIVADPKLIVADEPTGNLDAESAEGVLALLRRLNQERGKTVVMVTHDPRAAASGTRRCRLDKGKLEELASVSR